MHEGRTVVQGGGLSRSEYGFVAAKAVQEPIVHSCVPPKTEALIRRLTNPRDCRESTTSRYQARPRAKVIHVPPAPPEFDPKRGSNGKEQTR